MDDEAAAAPAEGGRRSYKEEVHALHIQLVRLQKHIIKEGERVLVIVEGRDAAGKDGLIKTIVRHLSPRETRMVALGKPSDRDRRSWYFQRFVPHLPAAEELVLFNRSWYNRAGVERVMAFCSDQEYRDFMLAVPHFEQMLIGSGIRLFKYYLDIDRATQKKRLQQRRTNPLKQWKMSPIDAKALGLWDDYSRARNLMLARTHTPAAPWSVARADHKRRCRLAVIKDLLARLDYAGKDEQEVLPMPEVCFPFEPGYLEDGRIAP